MKKDGEDFEIEYKQFTLSEFLEIRKKQDQPSAQVLRSGGRSLAGQKGKGFLRMQTESEKTAKDRRRLILFAVIGFAAVIIGGFFFLKLIR